MNASVGADLGLIWGGSYRVVMKCPKQIEYGHAANASGGALTILAANEKIPLPLGRPTYGKTSDGSTARVELYEV